MDSKTYYREESGDSKPAVGGASDDVPDGVSQYLYYVCVKYCKSYQRKDVGFQWIRRDMVRRQQMS